MHSPFSMSLANVVGYFAYSFRSQVTPTSTCPSTALAHSRSLDSLSPWVRALLSTPSVDFDPFIFKMLGNNTIYAPGALVTIQCQGSMTYAQFESLGLDEGTQLLDANNLNLTDIIQMGRDVLGILV